MPSVLRRSGTPFTRPDGTTVEPRAIVHFCETCNAENAPFGIWLDGKLKSYCGWRDGEPVCVKGDERG